MSKNVKSASSNRNRVKDDLSERKEYDKEAVLWCTSLRGDIWSLILQRINLSCLWDNEIQESHRELTVDLTFTWEILVVCNK